jgi:hypothetical protein
VLKLDVNKWKADMESPAAKDRLEQDHRLEEDLKLKGTPTIYVNGRELDIEADEVLEERVESELGIVPGGAPSASPSTAPSAPASAAPSSSAVVAPH